MKNTFFLIWVLLCTSSCKIGGSFQGLYSYYNKEYARNPELFEKVQDTTVNICNLQSITPKVYIINGKQLRQCIKNSDKSLIYIWSPKCKGKFCYPLNILQTKCDNKNIDLYIVSEYYDSKLMQIDYGLKKSIYGIDTEYYKTNLTSQYTKLFFEDLDVNNLEEEKFLYYEKGLLSDKSKSIDIIERN